MKKSGSQRSYGWPENERFLVPDGVYERFAEGIGVRGARLEHLWTELFERIARSIPDLATRSP